MTAAAVPPPLGPVRRCRSCRAEVVWGQIVPGGRVVPVDAAPTSAGTVQLVSEPGRQPVRVRVLTRSAAAAAAAPLYTSHFATCPDAGAWRKTR